MNELSLSRLGFRAVLACFVAAACLVAPPRAVSQTCDPNQLRSVMITFEPRFKTGEPIFGAIRFKISGQSEASAFFGWSEGGVPASVTSGTTYWVDPHRVQPPSRIFKRARP
jgi:hypothetical protein